MTDNRFPPTPGIKAALAKVNLRDTESVFGRRKLMDNKTSLIAIRARIQGEWDNPALMSIGALDTNMINDILRILDLAETTPPPHVRKFLDLSTAHVSPAARQWLEGQAYAINLGGDGAWNVGAVRDGWFVYAPEMPHEWTDEDTGLHPDLRDAAVEARLCDCTYMLFDRDAEVIGTLPTYEEDEASDEGLTEEEKEALALADDEELDGTYAAILAAREGDADEGGLHDELDEASPRDAIALGADARALELDEWKETDDGFGPLPPDDGVAHSETERAPHIVPAGTPIYFTESGKRKLDKAGHAVIGRSALAELKEAANDILAEIDDEIRELQAGNIFYTSRTEDQLLNQRERFANALAAI